MATSPGDAVTELAVIPTGLSGWQKTKIILVSVFRTLLGIFFIAAVLVLVPARPHLNIWFPIVGIALMVGGYIWYFRLQLRRIRKANYPQVQAAEALILVAIMFLAIFALTYDMMSGANPAAFTEDLARFSAFYFAVTVLATVGFGDITPVTTAARSVVMLQMAIDIAFLAVAVKIVSGATAKSLAQRKAGSKAAQNQAY